MARSLFSVSCASTVWRPMTSCPGRSCWRVKSVTGPLLYFGKRCLYDLFFVLQLRIIIYANELSAVFMYTCCRGICCRWSLLLFLLVGWLVWFRLFVSFLLLFSFCNCYCCCCWLLLLLLLVDTVLHCFHLLFLLLTYFVFSYKKHIMRTNNQLPV